ncbi:dipeptidyl peptidase IV N-terminal region-domain-containing protein [Lipomyces oligophaga]|uniref:dipeptidyl peptidase IV N-terminal region-domain-containing protein n=1 Tax=Lipomyces oligophaga TaxID=45792 RepID=UPI0034CFFCEA
MEPLNPTRTTVASAAAATLNSTSVDSNADEEALIASEQAELKRKKFTKRIFFGAIATLVLLWVIGLIIYLVGNRGNNETGPNPANAKPIELQDYMSGTFRAKRMSINWLDDGIAGHDGLYAENNDQGKLIVGDYSGATLTQTKTLVDFSKFTYESETYHVLHSWPGKGLKKVLMATDYTKNWRHSYFARYWIFDTDTKVVEPLIPGNLSKDVRLASWSPSGETIAYVLYNNLYIRDVNGGVKQITTDGDKDTFYGIPDWVYEEEVFSGNSALWWSASGEYLAFLRSNDSMVPEYTIPYFERIPVENDSYPDMVDLKYPKAGYPNPVVELMFLDLNNYDVFLPRVDDPRNLKDDDRLITEVLWTGEKVLVRQTNRESDLLKIVIIDPKMRLGSVVREEDVSGGDGGWFEVTHDTTYIPANISQGRTEDGYIDTVILNGFNHLAYFEPIEAVKPKVILTSGSWEVVDAPSSVDLTTGTVYFLATKKDPTERHLYAVQLDGTNFRSVTDTAKDGYYSVSFSTGGGYALVTYNGPQVPWQKLLSTRDNNWDIIEENMALKETLKAYKVPEMIFEQVMLEEGVVANTFEMRPADFDPELKYPVLFHLYQGPGSQTVDKRFTIGFESHVASKMNAIVVSVDGRGTGFMGREFRAVVRDNLGYWESHDQILAAKIWANKPYVDASKIAIWGWSYGGYMTLKTLEQDGGETFKYGMAVAPVTDWHYYDSIYTERYMHTPENNPEGYYNSAIQNVTALKDVQRFLVMHGTGDDNVHIQHTLTMLDKFDLKGVENYDLHVFPDSDHSISFHNANQMVYDRLDQWLSRAFAGQFLV